MNVLKSQHISRWRRSARRSATARLNVELLESRNLPAALTGPAALAPVLPGDTANPADVAGAGAGTTVVEGPNSQAAPQDLGTLAPSNLVAGVTGFGTFQSETADYYQFQATETREVVLTLSNQSGPQGLPAGNWLTVTDTTINEPVYLAPLGDITNPASQVGATGQILMLAGLDAGKVYVLRIASWSTDARYGFRIGYPGENPEMPVPLPIGAEPAFRQRLSNAGGSLLAATAPSPSVPSAVASLSGATMPGGVFLPATVAGPGDGTGIIAASNPFGEGALSAAAASGTSNIPAGVFVALGAGSVGGFSGANLGSTGSSPDLYDRIYGQGPSLALSERLVGLAILSQIGTAANVDVTQPSPTVGADRQNLPGWWQNVLRVRGQEAGPPSAENAASGLPRTTGVLKADASPEGEQDDLLLDETDAQALLELDIP